MDGLVNFAHTTSIPTTMIEKMQRTLQISTPAQNGLYDITQQVEAIVAESGVHSGIVNVYVQGATAGIMILPIPPWGTIYKFSTHLHPLFIS